MQKRYEVKETAEVGYKLIEFINDRDIVTSTHILEEITPSRIKKDLKENQSITYKHGYVSGYYSAQELAEIEDDISISFENCVLELVRFNDKSERKRRYSIYKCSLKDVEFNKTTITDHFDIEESVFYSDVTFDQLDINSQFAISESTFMGDVLVIGAKGVGHFTWIGNHFHQQVKFWACFNKYLWLRGCSFFVKQKMLIDESCIKSVQFTSCEFSYSLNLFASDIEETLDLNDTYINGRLDFFAHEKENPLQINLSGLVASDGITVDWNRLSDFCEWESDDINNEIGTLSVLNKAFADNGQYEAQDSTYFIMRRRMAIRNWKSISEMHVLLRPFLYLWQGLGFVFYDLLGRYGTSFVSVLLSMIVTISLFAGGYYLSGLDVEQIEFITADSNVIVRMFGYVYYSSITFFTVGYGEITPDGIGSAWLAMIESFVGVFLMAYFVVAFTRKLTRQ